MNNPQDALSQLLAEMMYQELVGQATDDAITKALAEAVATPLAAGVTVRHSQDRFQTEATLVSIDAGNATVIVNGERAVWPYEGILDADRTTELVSLEVKAITEKTSSLMSGLTGDNEPAQELPTPGCDCPFCATFTPEQHAEALRLEAEGNAGVATA